MKITWGPLHGEPLSFQRKGVIGEVTKHIQELHKKERQQLKRQLGN